MKYRHFYSTNNSWNIPKLITQTTLPYRIICASITCAMIPECNAKSTHLAISHVYMTWIQMNYLQAFRSLAPRILFLNPSGRRRAPGYVNDTFFVEIRGFPNKWVVLPFGSNEYRILRRQVLIIKSFHPTL